MYLDANRISSIWPFDHFHLSDWLTHRKFAKIVGIYLQMELFLAIFFARYEYMYIAQDYFQKTNSLIRDTHHWA